MENIADNAHLYQVGNWGNIWNLKSLTESEEFNMENLSGLLTDASKIAGQRGELYFVMCYV
jgi:hypothetical protein